MPASKSGLTPLPTLSRLDLLKQIQTCACLLRQVLQTFVVLSFAVTPRKNFNYSFSLSIIDIGRIFWQIETLLLEEEHVIYAFSKRCIDNKFELKHHDESMESSALSYLNDGLKETDWCERITAET